VITTTLFLLLATAAPEQSVVRVQVYSSRHDWVSPWKMQPVGGGMGSGFLIEGGRILTNAHVIRDARQVLVKKRHVADPFIARIEAIGDDCDLAVLRVDDPAFMKGMTPLKLGGLPKTLARVTTYGFPLGGEEVSSTSGIVSRIEWRGYVHSGSDAHLVIQTDAAINPGNSGGPVISDGKLVGVAFQGLPGADNVGFFIPAPVVQHFLKDLDDGAYQGFPDSGLRASDLISPAHKAERRLPAGKSGVFINAVRPGGTFDGVLQEGDVLMQVEKDVIGDDGNITVADAQVPFYHALDTRQVGETVNLAVLRGGEVKNIKAVSRRLNRADRYRGRYGVAPRYLVHAGLVFMPLDAEYLRTFGGDFRATAPRELLWHHFLREWQNPEEADREVVVVSRMLRHPVNSQMVVTQGSIVSRVNGKTIGSLKDLADALDGNSGEFDMFEFEGSNTIEALSAKDARQAHKTIMKTYAITKDRNL